MRLSLKPALLALALAALSFLLPPTAHAESKRLILKDGSYQSVVKYEVKGDRVRYLSAERFEWEEIPSSLIDWPATERWEKERGAVSEDTKEVSAEMEAERKEEEAKSPTVAPGLRLPSQGGVFLLDDFRGQKQLAELVQSGGEINKQTGKNILRAAINPFSVARQSIELKGTRARVQAHEDRPLLYVNVDTDPDAGAAGRTASSEPEPQATQRFRIVRLEKKKDTRVVGNLKIAITGSVKQQQSFVDAAVTPMSGGWMRIVPATPLAAGEYAIVEMLSPKEINLYVWDFGVDPAAPANTTAWKPAPVQNTESGTSQTPVLQGRPQ
ncbi:MAG TPA: hypothetical protein VE825_00905 [Terriglobales bacterium]|jgi:hypothetical protein|nr:hypothetical protein [Terriglobales bacterium]